MMTDWRRALSWRLRMQLLDPVGTETVEGVVERLGAVPAQSIDAAELAVRTRRVRSETGEVSRALAAGTLIRTFAFRGASHLMTPSQGAVYLALRASGRMWELPSWQRAYGLSPSDWPALRATVRDALGDKTMTIDELGVAVTSRSKYRHLSAAFADRSCTFVKPFAWQGDICFAPSRDGRATFQRLDRNPLWTGLTDTDAAGRSAVLAYLRAYGPATAEHLQYWLGAGLGAARKGLRTWIADLRDHVTSVDVEGVPAMVLREHEEDLLATEPSSAVALLPGHDQWVLGPGTADEHVVPPVHRTLVTRGSNLVVAGGVVSGTWSLADGSVVVNWFAASPPPNGAVAGAVGRLSVLLDRPLEADLRSAGSAVGTPSS